MCLVVVMESYVSVLSCSENKKLILAGSQKNNAHLLINAYSMLLFILKDKFIILIRTLKKVIHTYKNLKKVLYLKTNNFFINNLIIKKR